MTRFLNSIPNPPSSILVSKLQISTCHMSLACQAEAVRRLVTDHFLRQTPIVEQEIDSFIRFLATERGLSDNYQFSTRRSLAEFAEWCSSVKKITAVRGVTQPVISDYLAARKKSGLAAASI